jgi:hypothetical protein
MCGGSAPGGGDGSGRVTGGGEVEVRTEDGGAFSGKKQGGSSANAGTGAGDKSDLPGDAAGLTWELIRHGFSSRRIGLTRSFPPHFREN